MLEVYSVFDSKAERYLQPIFAQTEASAVRSLTAAVSDPSHDFHRFAEDYSLFQVGAWDDERGALEGLLTPRQVVGCWTIKAALKARNGEA